MKTHTSAEWLEDFINWRKGGISINWLLFHRTNPSTFHNGAFIFADGSIWWAR